MFLPTTDIYVEPVENCTINIQLSETLSLFLLYASFPHFLLKVWQFSILFPRSQTGLLVGLLVDPMVQEKVCQEFEVNLFLA